MGSKPFSFDHVDIKKILKGALVAICGAFLTYVTQIVGNIDFGTWTPLIVAFFSVIVNAANRFLSDYSQKQNLALTDSDGNE